jgi:heptosyltransferase II
MAQRIPLLHSFKHIAVIQTAFIGDVALVLYMMQTLRSLHPTAILTLVTTPLGATLAQYCPAINHVIAFDKRKQQSGFAGMRAIVHQLRTSGVDCILAPHRSLRTTLITRLASPSWSVGFSKSAFSWLYKQRVEYPALHEAERNLYLLSGMVDIPGHALQPVLSLPEQAHRHAQSLLAPLLARQIPEKKFSIIALAPGSVWATKRYTQSHVETVARILLDRDYGVVLVGGNDDIALCEAIHNACRNHPHSANMLNCTGTTSLIELIALLQCCTAILTNDSAPTHLANLAGCRVVSVFGPTVPAFGFAPRGVHDALIARSDLPCRPCSTHGAYQCPIGTHECMTGIAPEQVAEVLVHG